MMVAILMPPPLPPPLQLLPLLPPLLISLAHPLPILSLEMSQITPPLLLLVRISLGMLLLLLLLPPPPPPLPQLQHWPPQICCAHSV
jgi:hypothetical protein